MKGVVFLFPGQGSQFPGMCKDIYNRNSIARQVFEEASDSIKIDMKKLCFERSENDLMKSENAQPAILTAGYASFSVLIDEIGVRPDFMAGHSLGEITALTCAGGIKFSDAVKIAKQRGVFMQEAAAGGGCMTSISGLDADVIEAECKRSFMNGDIVCISNYNSVTQTVISGHLVAVEAVENNLRNLGAEIIRLKVNAPFHSMLMQPVVKKLRAELEKYEYSNLRIPVISSVDAKLYNGCEVIIEYLTQQVIKPVRWRETVEYLLSNGMQLAVELSPGSILTNIIKKSNIDIQTCSYDYDSEAIRDTYIQTKRMDTYKDGASIIRKCMGTAVSTNNINWDNDEYYRGVIVPYNRVQQMYDELEENGKEPSNKQVQEALIMLKSVFITKRTPMEEQVKCFEKIIGKVEIDGFDIRIKEDMDVL